MKRVLRDVCLLLSKRRPWLSCLASAFVDLRPRIYQLRQTHHTPPASSAECPQRVISCSSSSIVVMHFSAFASVAALLALRAVRGQDMGTPMNVSVSFDQTYDNPNNSMDIVACSDGINGLITRSASAPHPLLFLLPPPPFPPRSCACISCSTG